MLSYPNIDPVAIHLGVLSIHWYGLMYLVGFLGGWSLLSFRLQKTTQAIMNTQELSDVLFYVALGVVLGGRIGYMLFYAWPDFIANPLLVFKIWQGGMSFHGGCLGVIIAMWLFARKQKKSLVELADFIVPVIPIGLGAGRIGNFINGELWGKVTNVPWAMVFPKADAFPRHPSQLYECFFEGIILFLILWTFSKKPRPRYAVSGLFLFCYGLFRFGLEFFREPDPQIGYLAFGWLTKGQLLSIPMILIGMGLLIFAYKNRNTVCNNI